MPYQALHYVPKDDKEYLRSLPVLRVVLVAHEKRELALGPANRWGFYLGTSDNTFVRILMFPSRKGPRIRFADYLKARFTVTHITNFNPTQGALNVETIEIVDEVKVGDVVDLLVREGLTKHVFDARRDPSSRWLDTAISSAFKIKLKWANSAQWEKARTSLGLLWPDGGMSALQWGLFYRVMPDGRIQLSPLPVADA